MNTPSNRIKQLNKLQSATGGTRGAKIVDAGEIYRKETTDAAKNGKWKTEAGEE